MKVVDTNNQGTYIEFCTHELTFLGQSGQPYRGMLFIQYISEGRVVDMLALKKYIESLKLKTLLLEDVAKAIHTDLNVDLNNQQLCVTVKTTPRGGLSTTTRFGYTGFTSPEIKPIVFGG